MNSIITNNPNICYSSDINNYLYNNQQENFSNKKEWIEIYRKIVNSFKNEEKNLINTFLSQDFHLSKLYKNSLTEEETENSIIRENIKVIKNHILDSENIFKGVKIAKNKEIRVKINKLEEIMNSTRLDFKNKFESLLNEEEELEKEIIEIQSNLENSEIKQEPEIIHINNNDIEEKENTVQNNNFFNDNSNCNKNKGINLEKILDQIENDKKYFNFIYSKEDINKFGNSFENLDEIKDIITLLENKIGEVGGPTQGWENKDHQEFLKLRTHYKNKINTLDFLSDLENALPYLSRADLKTHITLFNKFDKFYNVKKTFIERYKAIKEEFDNEKKKVMMDKLDLNNKNTKLKMKESAKNVEEKKKLVEEWKKTKEKEQIIQQQAKLIQENVQKEKEMQKFFEIIEKNKIVLQEYHKQKEIEKFEKDLDDSSNVTKKRISEIDLERIKEKNMLLEEKRKLIVKSKSIKSIRETENFKKYQIKKVEKMAKVESKLDYKTTAVLQKQRTKHDFQSNKDACTMANNVLGKLSRAIPEWRKSVI